MSVILKPTKVKYKDPDSKQYVGINAISDDTAANVIGNWLDDHPEATTTVQDGSLTISKFNGSLKTVTLKDCIIPDLYTGTDTEKIQSCLDELKNTGGTILITRRYQLDNNLINKLRTDQTRKKSISFLGIGKESTIDMGTYSFVSDLSNDDIGGLHFINMNFEGTNIFLNSNKMIRLFFFDCRFNGFEYVIYGEGGTQSLYFTQCYFERVSEYVLVNATSGVWDVKFSQCICENGGGFYNGDPEDNGNTDCDIIIRDCCIESMTKSCIVPSSITTKFIISGCYFEAAQPIDLSRCGNGNVNGITISDNVFFLGSDVAAIIMPINNASANYGIRGTIDRNVCYPDSRTLAKSDASYNGLIRYQFISNTGIIDVPERYATYTPLYGEVVTTNYNEEVASNADVIIDSSKDFRKAISITLVEQGSNAGWTNPGCFVYTKDSGADGGKLFFHNGANTVTVDLRVVSIFPTN